MPALPCGPSTPVFPLLCLQSLLSYCLMTCGPGMLSFPSSWCPSLLSEPFLSAGHFNVAFLSLSLSPIFALEKHLILGSPPATRVASPGTRHAFAIPTGSSLSARAAPLAYLPGFLHTRWSVFPTRFSPDLCGLLRFALFRSIPLTPFLTVAPWAKSCS